MKFIFSVLFILLSINAYSQDSTCGKGKHLNVKYEWCIYPTDRSKNADILYFMHGMWSSEKSWKVNGENKDIRAEWARLKYTAPTVIGVTFGREWLLSEVEGSRKLYTIFTEKIMPELEAKVGGLKTGNRQIMGRSMGGFNSSQLVMKNAHMFTKIGLFCPAIPTIGPFSTDAEVADYIKRTGAKKSKVNRVLEWIREEFPTPQDWSNHNPLELASRSFNPNFPSLFVSCGREDEYGFFEGSQVISDLAKHRGVKMQFVPVKGDHCQFDPIAAARFFAN